MPTFTQQQIKEISEQLDWGFRAFYHKQTRDLIFIPDADKHFALDIHAWQDDIDKLHKHLSDYHEIEAMEANDLFQFMADFAGQVSDPKLRDKLMAALNDKKPFRHFKFVIDNAGKQRQSWFDFKNKRYIEWTAQQIKIQNDIDEQKKSDD